jgi:protocatechuate 3,4-dioxygenase beta subunit
MADDHMHDHDRGLAFDLSTLVSRRRALQMFAVGGLAVLVGCGSSSDGDTAGATTAPGTTAPGTTSATAPAASGGETPTTTIAQETAGPFPGDGSNGPNALAESGIVRQDITSSVGIGSGTAEGVPLTMTFRLLDVSEGGAPLAGAAVYVWHCDREGRYSLYSEGVTGENYLRGVQETDADGRASFTTVFPGCYPGRWPHVHFEVYESIAAATGGGTKLLTSQLAFPKDACDLAYGAEGYAASVANLAVLSLDTDLVFSDGYATQLGTVTGDPDSGMAVRLNVGA